MNRPPLFYANEFEKYLVFSKITPDGDYEYKFEFENGARVIVTKPNRVYGKKSDIYLLSSIGGGIVRFRKEPKLIEELRRLKSLGGSENEHN